MTGTIFAPATAPGRAAVAVVRLSGPATGAALAALAGPAPEPRRASLRTLRAADGEALDRALVLWMPGPASYTGEDAAELHLHGGPAVVEGVLDALRALGLRLAEPGEFTRRAFVSGRMDLVEAEGVADLVDAQSAAQRRQALGQLGGETAARHAAWRETLLDALAHLEAAVDFPDEDLPEEVDAAAADRRGERVREGLRVALVGAPNAGKSTLLNGLLGRDAAIVTPIPGTTRDIVEGGTTLAGVPAVIADTAGLRESDDPIEAEGVRRARAWASDADLRVGMLDLADPAPAARDLEALLRPDDLIVANKADLAATRGAGAREGGLTISALDPAGVAAVRAWLEAWAARLVGGAEPPAATRLRHRLALADAAEALGRATAPDRTEPELMAEDVRLAARALQRLSGRLDAEDVLGRVFSSFCIGK